MWVYVALAIIGGGSVFGILGAVLWVLTRPADRIQLATLCLFGSTLTFFATAWQLLGKESLLLNGIGVALGLFAALLYAAMGVLALYYKPWAWQVAITGFVVHLVLAAAGSVVGAGQGNHTVMAVAAVWLLVGATGLWSCMHRGSRELVARQRASAA